MTLQSAHLGIQHREEAVNIHIFAQQLQKKGGGISILTQSSDCLTAAGAITTGISCFHPLGNWGKFSFCQLKLFVLHMVYDCSGFPQHWVSSSDSRPRFISQKNEQKIS